MILFYNIILDIFYLIYLQLFSINDLFYHLLISYIYLIGCDFNRVRLLILFILNYELIHAIFEILKIILRLLMNLLN
jgi:hypothetical protein